MNCQDFWCQFPQRGHDVSEQQSAHLAECPACAARWEPHRALAAGLHSMVEEWRRGEAPARVETGLTAAFRLQTRARPRQFKQHSWWTPVFAWAAAAAAMVALAFILVRGWQPGAMKHEDVAAPHRSAQFTPEVASVLVPSAETDDDSSVLGDGFVRLPNAARIGPNEDYNVVRFEVPGSTMIALGLAVSEERASETVLADVALGSDGMARAVRLVPEGGSLEE
jgi:hypothetical protein